MNKVIKFLHSLRLDLDDEKTARYLISLCGASEDFMELYSRLPERRRVNVLKAWDGFEKNGGKKRGLAPSDLGFVFQERHLKGEAGRKNLQEWRRHLLQEIQKFGRVVADSPRLTKNVGC